MNGLTRAAVDNVVGSFIESLCSALLIHGDNFSSTPKHFEASEHSHAVLNSSSFNVASPKFCDARVGKLVDEEQDLGKAYLALKG